MKRTLAFTTALALLASPFTSFTAGSASAETVVEKHPARHTVIVKKTAHGAVVVRRGVGHRVVWHRPPVRPGHFWHRGRWFVRAHGPAFHYPRGWHYRRWVVGAILPSLFLSTDYFYDNYGALGLEAPPLGYRWVRYGDDLLLVNVRTGEVEDVVYDAFD